MTYANALAELAGLADDVVGRLGEADLNAAVPPCPGWTVADLVVHLGQVHRWAEHCIRRGNPDAPEVVAPTAERSSLAGWYAESAGVLVQTLRATDPDAPCWTFGPHPRMAAFWLRRQQHELAMHRWDLGAALGRDLGYPDALAADAVDEVVTVFFPRQVRLGRIPSLGATLRVRADGSDRTWVLHGNGAGPSSGPVDAEVSGAPDGLALLLWGRVSLDDHRVRVSGDRVAAATVVSAGLVP